MARAKSRGITLSKNVSPPVRTGSPNRATSPGAADQLGQATAFKKEQCDTGRAYDGAKLGNELALNVGKGSPGAGRTTTKSGSQGTWGEVKPGQVRGRQGYEITDFGPDIPGRNYKP
jgi:hypothetical protein